MAKLTQSIQAPVTKDGNVVNLAADVQSGENVAYRTVEPKVYFATVTGISQETFKGRDGTTYLKIQPEFELHNEFRTKINRQDFLMGYWDDEKKQLYHNDPTKSVVWGGDSGALFFLKSIGAFRDGGDGKFVLDFNAKLTKDRIIKVSTSIAGYVKGNTELTKLVSTAVNFAKMANEAVYEMSEHKVRVWTMSDLERIIVYFNEQHGLSREDGLKTKNVVIACYTPSEKEIEANEWYLDKNSGAVYMTKASYDWYNVAEDEDTDAAEGSNNDW